MRIRRRNLGWLTVIGSMIGVAALSPQTNPASLFVLLGVFGSAVIASMVEFQPAQLVERSRSQLTAMRMSSDAREAVERARKRGGSGHVGVTLLDVGLIATQSGPDGIAMRRSRDASKDDDGVRPFAVMQVSPTDADRNAIVRFEFIDQNGQRQYVHEMNVFLRDGEMNLLPELQMPLYQQESIMTGDWDLRMYVDNRLVGAYAFSVTPSLEDRFPRAARERAERRLRAEDKEETPLRLEDLLREQQSSQRTRGR